MGFLYVFLLRGEDAPKWKQFEDVYESWVFFCPGLKWFSASIFLIEIPIDLWDHPQATTTAMICGLVDVEFLKLVMGTGQTKSSDSQLILENVGDI